MIQTKLIIPKIWQMPEKKVEIDEQFYDKNQKKDITKKVIRYIFDDENPKAKDLPVYVIQRFKKIRSMYGNEKYYERLDQSLNRWLEKFHLEIVARNSNTFTPKENKPHIIDIKYQVSFSDEYETHFALVVFEDGH